MPISSVITSKFFHEDNNANDATKNNNTDTELITIPPLFFVFEKTGKLKKMCLKQLGVTAYHFSKVF